MWKIIEKFQSGLEFMTAHMIDEDFSKWTTVWQTGSRVLRLIFISYVDVDQIYLYVIFNIINRTSSYYLNTAIRCIGTNNTIIGFERK